MRWPLSALEQALVGEHAWPVEFTLLYGAKLDADALRAGLARVRPDFPLLWGRVEADAVVADDADLFEVEGPDRAATLRVTTSEDGSMVTAKLSHAIADGSSFFSFLAAWARATRGKPWTPPVRELGPFVVDVPTGRWTPARLRDTLGATWVPGILRRDPLTAGHDAAPLAIPSITEGVTEADVAAALCWKTFGLRWAGEGDARPLAFPVDLRGRLPGLSPAYFGNAVALVSLALDRDALDVAPVALLARQIHLAVARYDAARARAAVGAAAAFGATHAWDEVHLVDPRGGVLVSNLARAPLAQLDFGAGPPAAILPRTHCPRLVFVLPGRDGQVVLHAQAPRPLPPRRTGKPADVVPFRAR